MYKKNIVIGAAIGYTVAHIKNFVISFRRVNQTDMMVLLVTSIDDDMRKFMEKYWVIPVNFNPYAYNTLYANSRFIGILDLIIGNYHQFNNVFLTDVRDVIFQKNVFAESPNEPHLYLFAEDSGVKIIDEDSNKKWITNLYGEERLAILGTKPIICSGTILGDPNSIINLLSLMTSEINSLSRNQQQNFVDQAILNNLYHTGMLDHLPVELKKNGNIVATICATLVHQNRCDKLHLDMQNNLVEVNDIIPSVVHQYDRNKLFNMLYELILVDP